MNSSCICICMASMVIMVESGWFRKSRMSGDWVEGLGKNKTNLFWTGNDFVLD